MRIISTEPLKMYVYHLLNNFPYYIFKRLQVNQTNLLMANAIDL